MAHFSDFDFAIAGTGSGGGIACRILVEAGFNVIAFEAGPDFSPDIRRGQMTQSVLDEEVKADWLQFADSEMTEYGVRKPQNNQGLGKMVGGSSNHFGMVCYQGTPEDYDEWDYLLQDGLTGLSGTMTWDGSVDVVGMGIDFRDELEVGDWIQLDTDVPGTGTGAPYLSPPFQVVSIEGPLALTIAQHDMVGATPPLLIPSKVGETAHKCTDWNRSKMLQHYKAVEFDIDAVLGNMPASSLGAHGTADDTQQEQGRVGSMDPAAPSNFSDVRGTRTGGSGSIPGFVTPRINDGNLRQMVSLLGSTVNGAAFDWVPDRNNWDDASGKPGGYPDRHVHKIVLNYVGFDSDGTPIAGGHGSAAHTHLNKYDERRSTLIVHVDRIRQKDLAGLWIFDGTTTVVADGPSGASTDDVRAADHVRLNNGGPTNFKVASKTPTTLTLQNTFSLASFQLDAIPAIGDTIVFSDSVGVIATFLAVTGAPGADQFQVADVGVAATKEGVAHDLIRAINDGGSSLFGIASATKKGAVITLQADVTAANLPGGTATNAPLTLAAGVGTDMTVLVGTFAGAKAIPSGTGPITVNANFTLVPQAVVDTIRLTNESGTLTMSEVNYVETEHGEQIAKTIKTNKVILACGPYGTPGLLLRSGIGGMERLAPHGIAQVIDSPGVGADCLQHAGAGAAYFGLTADNPSIYSSFMYGGQYRSSFGGVGGPRDTDVNKVGTPLVLFDEDPEVQMFTISGGWDNLGTAKTQATGIGLAAKRARRDSQRNNCLTIAAIYKPRSRGHGIELKSTDPHDTFVLRDGCYQQRSSFDAEAGLEAINVIGDKLADATGALATTGLAAITAFAAPVHATLEAVVAGGGGHYHAVSTCKMGVRDSANAALSDVYKANAVCDEKAVLNGAEGVWIVDNSIYPTHTRANPHQPTIAHSHQICTNLISTFRPFGV